jgi:glyoxylase-like metal-dependent hydrolase (beta-lactamase superfamily II)
VWGTCGLGDGAPSSGAGTVQEVVACEATADRFREDVPADLERRRSAAAKGALDAVRLVPPTVTFETSLALDLGGATLHLHLLPGHTRDCIVGVVPQWGVLLAGDTVETPLPVVNDGAAVRRWIERLDRWAADPSVTVVVPAHGRVGGRELIEETASYLRRLVSAVAHGSPATAAVDLSSALAFYAKTHARNLQRVAEAALAPMYGPPSSASEHP